MTSVLVRSVDIGCERCAGELEHCHGTLVLHVDGSVECTGRACSDVDQVRHGLVIDCADGCFAACGCLL